MKNILASFIICLSLGKLYPQGLYLHTNSAYGMSLASREIGGDYSSTGNVKLVRTSFGKGLDLGFGAGYMLTKNIGVECNFNYLIGGKTQATDASNTSAPADVYVLKGRMLRIIPTVKISTGEKIRVYSKIGLVLGVFNRFIEEDTYYYSNWMGGVDKSERTTVMKGGISMGFKGNLGVDFALSDRLDLFSEVYFISQAWAPKKAEITRYLFNGEDKLGTLTTRQRETEFVDEYNYNTTIPDTQPDKSLKIYLPYSSWGINIGIKIKFGKKE